MLIIFDLDDTLIDTTGSVTPVQLERALHRMIEAGLRVNSFEEAIAKLKQIDLSCESSTQSLKKFLDSIGADSRFLALGQQVVYGEIPDNLVVIPLDQALEVLKNLSKNNLLALVSIGNPDQQRFKMEKAGLDSTLFSKIAISTQEDKKSSYQSVLDELGVAPQETIVCGDRIRRDLTPAKQLGCLTIQMKWGRGLCSTGESADVDFKIHQLNEIQGIIEKL
jgi:putative hydrolase of the HAD superfamily